MAIEPHCDEEEFPAAILEAFAAYPAPSPSKGFEARFWTQLEARRGRYHGLIGMLRHIWELEIEGVAVWRLAASTFTGGISCAILLGFITGNSLFQSTSPTPLPLSAPDISITGMNAFAFYRREWENELDESQTKLKGKTVLPPTPIQGGKLSWNYSNAHLA